MTRETHILLHGGSEGISEWNRRRMSDSVDRDLSQTDLRRADLRGADLQGVDLHGADLTGADLSGGNLSQSNLRGTDLSEARLRGTNLAGADLTEARCGGTDFVSLDLSGVMGLDSIRHESPSSLGIDTLMMSRGMISEAFLRGCGVPESIIVNRFNLIGSMEPIQFYSCFISYSAKDSAFAERIHADLQSRGVRCWYAPVDLKIGERIRFGLDESIRLHDKVMLILSESSISSNWVEHEVERALRREDREKRLILLPLRLDDAVMRVEAGWPAEIRRSRHIGDFRRWKDHDSYQKAFARLLNDLKAEKPTSVSSVPIYPPEKSD